MTAQEIFDKAAVGLLTQKAKSYLVNPDDGTESSTCAYRGANGKKCAAGFCIEDSLYTESMEKKYYYWRNSTVRFERTCCP